MTLCRVMGSVISTAKHPFLEGHRLMTVKAIDRSGNPKGKPLVALDMAQSGPGDLVLVLDEGNSARTILGDKSAPARTVIVGIVDAWSVEDA